MLTEDLRKVPWYCVGIGLTMFLAGSFTLVQRSRVRKMDTPHR